MIIIYLIVLAPFAWRILQKLGKLYEISDKLKELPLLKKILFFINFLYAAFYLIFIVYLFNVLDAGMAFSAGGAAVFILIAPLFFIILTSFQEALFIPLEPYVEDKK